jgi:hypothetical protein
MAQELKHVGRVKATNKKCLIAYRTLPGDAYSCLIVPTENMPDIYHDALINLVESGSAQSSYEFAEALDRTQFPDGSRMLPWLHANNRLIKAPTNAIEVTPTVQTSILLSELNQIIAEQRGVPVDQLSLQESQEKETDKATAPKLNDSDRPAKATSKVDAAQSAQPTIQANDSAQFDSPEAEAKWYRSQADRLAKEAASYRRKAEELVPTKKTA